MTNETHHTDLGRDLAVIREEAQRRIQWVERRWLDRIQEGTAWRRFSTDELVARVEGHAEFFAGADEMFPTTARRDGATRSSAATGRKGTA